MKKLFLLRHAKADNPAGTSDKDRPLTSQGHSDARALGQIMKQKDYRPDFVLCSPALRTQQTYENVMKSFDDIPTECPKDLYYGSTKDIFEIIPEIDNQYQTVLIVGHNPSIHEMAGQMPLDGPESLIKRLMSSYKPGTLSAFECAIDGWEFLKKQDNTLVDYLEPLDYNAPAGPTRWT